MPFTPLRFLSCMALALLVPLSAGQAAEDGGLPQPLTLGEALSLADRANPVIDEARAALAQAQAQAKSSYAQDDLSVDLSLEARYIEPPDVTPDNSNDDSRAVLLARKRLYDFGRSSAREAAADSLISGREAELMNTLASHRIQVMQRFFNVLLADQEFARLNEAMAVAYVQLDKARDQNQLGQLSDIELARLENVYQQVRTQRYAAESRQRETRSLLAQALGRPDDLPADLAPPALPGLNKPVPDYEELVKQAKAHNPQIKALRADLEAATQRITEARAGRRPELSAQMEAGAYQRSIGSNDPFRASLILQVPLYQGNRVDAAVAKAIADRDRLQARLRAVEYRLRQDVLDNWLKLSDLKAQADQSRALSDYRDLYLDQARAEYELDFKTDLGDAMVQQTAAQILRMRTRFEKALTMSRLAALTNDPNYDPTQPPTAKQQQPEKQP
ncbi:MAG: TolC family protein [Gammaproteobacteria bacterium]|jgi:outer membrane protein TolC